MARIHLTAEELAANPQLAARIRAAQEAEAAGVSVDVETLAEDNEEIPSRSTRRAETPRRSWVLIATVAASVIGVGWAMGSVVLSAAHPPARRSSAPAGAPHSPAPITAAPGASTQAASEAQPPVVDQAAPPAPSQVASQAPAQTPTAADPPPTQEAGQLQPTAPPSGPVTQPQTGYDVYGSRPPAQQVTLQPIMSEPGPCPVVISGTVTGYNNRINLPIGIQSSTGMMNVRAILDTGASRTMFNDTTLRNAGYKPVSGQIQVSGVGSGPLKAYWYRIPAPSVAVDGAWRPIMTESLLVMGVVNYPMPEALIGPDALRTTTLKMSGSNWTLLLPCTP